MARAKEKFRYERRHFGKVRFQAFRLPADMGDATVVRLRQAPRSVHPCVRHRRTREWICIVKGRVTGIIGKRKVRLERGDAYSIPPGTWHTFVTGARGVEALCVFSPAVDPRKPDVEVRAGSPR